MFGTILITVVSLMQAYVFWRACSVPFIQRHLSRRILIGTGVLFWMTLVLGWVFHDGETGLLAALGSFGMYWAFIVFLLAVCVLATDLFTGFGFFLPRHARILRGWALLVGGILSLAAFVQGFRPPIVQSYEVQLDGLPANLDGTVIVVLSDLHLGTLLGAEWMAHRVDQVEAEKPDIVFLLGDILEGHGKTPADMLPVLNRLSAPMGVWTVPGNHESYGRRDMPTLEDMGFHVLRDSWVSVRPGLVVAGVDYKRGENFDRIEKTLAGRPAGAVILLSHMPVQADAAARAGVKLMLSGHTHGGQVWPFGYLSQRKFPLFAGRYEIEGMPVIVSRGTGVWGARMRLWAPAEIVKVTLRRK